MIYQFYIVFFLIKEKSSEQIYEVEFGFFSGYLSRIGSRSGFFLSGIGYGSGFSRHVRNRVRFFTTRGSDPNRSQLQPDSQSCFKTIKTILDQISNEHFGTKTGVYQNMDKLNSKHLLKDKTTKRQAYKQAHRQRDRQIHRELEERGKHEI